MNHYLNAILDNNLNLANPHAKIEWGNLISYLQSTREDFHTQYPNDKPLDGIYGIVRNEEKGLETPRKLVRMGKEIDELISTTKQSNNKIKNLMGFYLEVAQKSNDRTAIDIAVNTGEKLLEKLNIKS